MRYLILSLILPFPLATQQASPYIPIGHWSTPYVEHLISAGVMADHQTSPLISGASERTLPSARPTMIPPECDVEARVGSQLAGSGCT